MKDITKTIILSIVITLIFVITAVLGAYLLGKNIYCPNISQELNMNTKYNFWSEGCYIEVSEGKWISNTNYRITN